MKRYMVQSRLARLSHASLGLTLILSLAACGSVDSVQPSDKLGDQLNVTVGSSENHLNALGIDTARNKIAVLTQDGQDYTYIQNQYIAKVADAKAEKQLQKLLKKYNGYILDDGTLTPPPGGKFVRDPGPRIYKLIELTVPVLDDGEVKDILKKYVNKGDIKFNTQEAADAYAFVAGNPDNDSKGLELELNLAGFSQANSTSSQENLLSNSSSYATAGDQWWLNDSKDSDGFSITGMNVFDVWKKNDQYGRPIAGGGIPIAIIDRGFASSSPDMLAYSPRSLSTSLPYRYDREDIIANGRVTQLDPTQALAIGNFGGWHGMHVADFAMASAGNRYGIAGVAPEATPYLITIGANALQGPWGAPLIVDSYYDAGKAVDFAVGYGAKVINMSFGFYSPGALGVPGTSLGTSLQNADNQGVIAVAAAGNDGNLVGKDGQLNFATSLTFVPAAWKTVISVGATDRDGNRSRWSPTASSNYGTIVDIWAPGSNLWLSSTPNTGCYPLCTGIYDPNGSGTSFSAPLVAGAIALMVQVNPAITRTQALSYIQSTAKRSGEATVNAKGIINVAAAVAATPVPPRR